MGGIFGTAVTDGTLPLAGWRAGGLAGWRAEAMDGQLTIESNPGIGAISAVVLPVPAEISGYMPET
jgi:hypothetical protein